MTTNITGACLCGNVTFSYNGEIADAAYCHCTDCRRTTGSAFNISIGLEAARFEITGGAPKEFTKTADSDSSVTRHFCGDCGAPLFTTSPSNPDRIYVKAGALDDPGIVRPAFQSWTRSKVSWAKIPAGLPRHDEDRR